MQEARHGDARRYRGGPAHDRRSRAAHALAAGAAAFGADRRRSLRQIRESCRSPIRSRSAAPASSWRRLAADERRRGVIAMSAGNHAQAVAYHARRLGIPATIVMPVTTPFVKVKATEAHGATVVLDGETLDEAQVARRSHRGGTRSGLGPPLRRSAYHRRTRHHRARNAGGGARSRCSGHPDRRRWVDRRQCHCGAGQSSHRSTSSASNARSIRRCGMRSIAAICRAAALHWPRALR